MPRRVMEGRVVSDKGNKTITVLVERRIMDPVYKKFIRRSKKYAAHDEGNVFRIGDFVAIEECAPISKSKRWKVVTEAPANARPDKAVVAALKAREEALLAKPEAKKKAAKAKTVKAEAAAQPAEAAEAKPKKAAKPKAEKTEAAPKAKAEKDSAEKPKAKASKKTKDDQQ